MACLQDLQASDPALFQLSRQSRANSEEGRKAHGVLSLMPNVDP